jgi:hypothetical protein
MPQTMTKETIQTPAGYIAQLPADRQEIVKAIAETLSQHLPEGFQQVMSYGMIGFVVPHSIFPDGYHCNPKLPLPFINLGSTKSHIALHHMGLYASGPLLDWIQTYQTQFRSAKSPG